MDLLREFLTKELDITDLNIFNKFELYNNFLLKWNSGINLISRQMTSIEANVLNSVFFLTKYNLREARYILDLGTGGGFPGIPLAILLSTTNITLVDSVRKKVNAVEDIIKKLNLKNITAACGRAEELSKEKKFSGKYDIVIAKSVSSLKNIYFWGKNFLNKNGKIICIKGGDIREELKELDGKIRIEIKIFTFEEKFKIEDKKIVIIQPSYN